MEYGVIPKQRNHGSLLKTTLHSIGEQHFVDHSEHSARSLSVFARFDGKAGGPKAALQAEYIANTWLARWLIPQIEPMWFSTKDLDRYLKLAFTKLEQEWSRVTGPGAHGTLALIQGRRLTVAQLGQATALLFRGTDTGVFVFGKHEPGDGKTPDKSRDPAVGLEIAEIGLGNADHFLVIASDSLWTTMSHDAVVSYALDQFKRRQSPQRIAEGLSDLYRAKEADKLKTGMPDVGSSISESKIASNDVTIILIRFFWDPTLPAEISRNLSPCQRLFRYINYYKQTSHGQKSFDQRKIRVAIRGLIAEAKDKKTFSLNDACETDAEDGGGLRVATPLVYAVLAVDTETIGNLLFAGADPNVPAIEWRKDGALVRLYPLAAALSLRGETTAISIASMLFNSGAKVNALSQGSLDAGSELGMPLDHLRARNQKTEISDQFEKRLLEQGAMSAAAWKAKVSEEAEVK
jgi:serine/threonine protein phosphatase PrpC